MEISGLEVGSYVHKHLGKVEITEVCTMTQRLHPSSSSVYIVHNGILQLASKKDLLKG